VRIIAADGSLRTLRISGVGRSLGGAQDVSGEEKAVVLYATPATVAALAGRPGFGVLAFRLRDARPAAVERTIARVRDELRAAAPTFSGFADLPEVREPGAWPGKEDFENFGSFFFIVTALALLAGFVLVSSTMTTLIAEQTSEIATMRAVGGRRRQITAVYLRTALALGALGVAIGVPLGVLLANVLVAFFGDVFFAVDAGFAVNWPIVVVSALAGLLGPVVAALPAIRRGVRLPLREALERVAVSPSAGGGLERALARLRALPRTVQIGLRSVGRRRRRSVSTVVIVALAVGNLLGVMALGAGISDVVRSEWDDRRFEISVDTSLRRPFDAGADRAILATPGVASAERLLQADARLGDRDGFLYGMPPTPVFDVRVADGRMYGAREEATGARVAVVEQSMANALGVGVGDTLPVTTGRGRFAFRVVGIAANQQENGAVAFVPRSAARAVFGVPEGVNQYWVRTTSADPGLIDRATTGIEDALIARGFEAGTEITYIGEQDNVAENQTLITSIAVLGFIVVAISMVGLVNAMTMSVLERTREIGILRCIGARSRDVRRIFTTEGVALALLGWGAGIPLGYALDRLLVWLVEEIVEVRVPVVYPAGHVAIAFAGTLVLALAVTSLPVRRATRLRPGDALRYS
jgi:putative ABC transport system permease protein